MSVGGTVEGLLYNMFQHSGEATYMVGENPNSR